MLIEATTGSVPFAADTTLATLLGRLERPITAPAATGPLGPILEAAGTIDPAARLDAIGLARALAGVAVELPAPAPLLLAGGAEGEAEVDRNPTDHPGRPRLFDGAQADASDPVDEVRHKAAPRAGGPAKRPDRSGSGRRAPRRRWRRAAMVAVPLALLLAAVGGLVVWASGALAPSHPVPGLIGSTPAVAERQLRPLHFLPRGVSDRGLRSPGKRRAPSSVSVPPAAGAAKGARSLSPSRSGPAR